MPQRRKIVKEIKQNNVTMKIDIEQFQGKGKLAAALANAQSEFKPIKQSGDASFYSKKARKMIERPYSTFGDYVDATREALCKYGLSVAQPIIEVWDEKNECWVKFLCTILSHGESEQAIVSTYQLQEIRDPETGLIDPQATGSDQSYAQRNAYRAILNLPPAHKEDSDGAIAQEAYEDKTVKPSTNSRQTPPVQKRTQPVASQPKASGNIANRNKALSWCEMYGISKEDVRSITASSFGGKLVQDFTSAEMDQLKEAMEGLATERAQKLKQVRERAISNGLDYYGLSPEDGELIRVTHFKDKPYAQFTPEEVQSFLKIAEKESPSASGITPEQVKSVDVNDLVTT